MKHFRKAKSERKGTENSVFSIQGELMKKFEIELDEMICKWLEHIADITAQPIESVIANGIYQQVSKLEELADKAFAYRE